MTVPLQVQTAPPPPDFTAASIQVPANIATPQSTMDNVKAGQSELNAVNTFSGGGSRSRSRGRGRGRGRGFIRQTRRNASIIRTYKGRKYQESPQKGGGSGGAITIPQVGSTCSSGPNCAGAQNAVFTSINNQAASNGANDAYAAQSGGRRGRKVRFSKNNRDHRNSSSSHSRKPRHDQSLTTMIAYNIKKVMRKVFS